MPACRFLPTAPGISWNRSLSAVWSWLSCCWLQGDAIFPIFSRTSASWLLRVIGCCLRFSCFTLSSHRLAQCVMRLTKSTTSLLPRRLTAQSRRPQVATFSLDRGLFVGTTRLLCAKSVFAILEHRGRHWTESRSRSAKTVRSV
jgi:hypothetical protein